MATPPPSPTDQSYPGTQALDSGSSQFNLMDFLIRQVIGKTATVTLVLVKAVDTSSETVDVQPMINQLDGSGNGHAHGTIFSLPYFRLQGGANAVIIDPVVGDIGLAAFCSRDISKVKATKAVANPGSRRSYDWADGLYMGGFLNVAPTQYMKMGGGVEVVSPVLSASRSLIAGNGATGSFSTPAGQVVNVQNGIVVSITP